MAHGTIEITTVRAWELTPCLQQRADALISADERAMVASRVFEPHRREQLLARALSRALLGAALGVAPAALRFRRNACGRPELVPPADIHFNITHTVEMVAVGVASCPLGIDAEPLARGPQILDVGASVFTEAELAGLATLDRPDRERRAVLLWTAKEAYMKALGVGFSCSPQSFDVEIDGEGLRLRGKAGARWALTFEIFEDHGFATCAPHGYLPVVRRGALLELLGDGSSRPGRQDFAR